MMLSYLGFPPTRPQSIELSQTIDNILTVLQSTLHGLLHLSFSASSTPIYISGDPTQLAQIINNLIDNSVEAIGTAPGSISVSVYEDHFCQRSTPSSPHGERIKPGRYACIEISDSGCGMDRKTLEKAIDPFFTTHFTGRGLGLSAVWGIVHAHQGYFFLNSEVGRGTVAKIFLPLSQLRDPALPKLLPPLRQAEIVVANKTILFVDDDQIVRKIGKLLLEDEGYHVIEAEGGKEAVALYRHHEKDILCVILDFAMPDQDGSITLNELRAVNPRLPVLLVSGFLKEQTADKFLTEKPNAFLQKPFNRDEFLHAIGEMLMSGG
jgi:CheY-like chemotaxis protein